MLSRTMLPLLTVVLLCITFMSLSFACARAPQAEDGTITPPPPPATKDDVAPEIGKLAPDFTLQTLQGETVTLSQHRGKPVLLIFWVVHCEGCIQEIPYIQEFYDRHAGDVVLLAVHVGDARAQIEKLLGSRRITYPILIDADEQVCITYRHGAPTAFAIDKEGTIRAIKDESFLSIGEIEAMFQTIKK